MNLNLVSGTYSFFCDSVPNQMEAVVGKPSLSCLVKGLSRDSQQMELLGSCSQRMWKSHMFSSYSRQKCLAWQPGHTGVYLTSSSHHKKTNKNNQLHLC